MGTLEQLRYRAASTGTGTLVVTIEQLNAIHADAQATIAALQARVQELERELGVETIEACLDCKAHLTQRTTELHETQNHLADADNEVEQLRKQLSERTAELEAVSNFIGVQYDAETRTWVSGQAPYLSAGTTKQEACIAAVDALRLACATWETKYRDLQAELERVRALVKALPKVEGEIRVIEVATDEWHVYDTIFATKAGADNYAALLQHRQGMEG